MRGHGAAHRAGARRRRHASARFSKFVIQRSTLEYELRKPKGTSNSMILVPLFDLKFLRRTRGARCRNFKSASLARSARGSPQPRECDRFQRVVLLTLNYRARSRVTSFGVPDVDHSRRGARAALQRRSARYACGANACVLRHPFVHLTAGWAMHRNGHARKAFEQDPLGLETGCNECTRARALNEYISQRRAPSGDAINVCGSVAVPGFARATDWFGANAGIATSPAMRNLPTIRF